MGRRVVADLRGARMNLALRRLADPQAPFQRPPDWRSKIEVVIPCYNHGPFLTPAFESIVDQQVRVPLAVTLIDDCSSDDTWEVMQRIQMENSARWLTVKAIRNPVNIRQWASLNRAIEESANRLFMVLNADDLLTPDCFEKVLHGLDSTPGIVMIGGSSLWFSANEPPPALTLLDASRIKLDVRDPSAVATYRHLNDLNMTQSSCTFFKGAWEAVGGYRPKGRPVHPLANEDRDFQMRVNALYPVGVYSDYPLAWYRTDSSQGKNF